ncbi:Leucine--tRNA ligase [Candidatus Kinetoplastibacterium sorsogonicusi]|uniref:Leucine--tRNA ligase n=1 Tax=Candidatus Kinetoplastidibacterium kentomonadis TaxID=1576550 RepID=A0A3S7J9G5_9PROT|nr:leucine--tRNA ligase [Candidatus Kinetoplastibacterium sorsogonicusi]AWD32304.1 Leucine--tRNA ligase [Candidatus Kinetoplastibacterium sorsogonicusi]
MKENYSHQEVEASTQKIWEENKSYLSTENNYSKFNIKQKTKFFACSMLPYPSGKLHMGHVRNYTINDVMTRYKRMLGFNVLMPMGWDAFGMPAENAAIKSNISPAKWTYDNISYMKKQMKQLGLSIDWSKEICACDPKYYKWNQWFFLKMLEKGIIYRKTQVVNWDPIDKTVLANEQVIDGKGWRSGALVEKREIPGYYLKITEYAEELLYDIKHNLKGWPQKVLSMQENWIGKSQGLCFAFLHNIQNENNELINDGKLFVFTTRADMIMGVTFCVISYEHPLATFFSKINKEIKLFVQECKLGSTTEANLLTKEKKGINTGFTVIHPINQEKIELWISNYVLMNYGNGAVMGVPGHDERDFHFAKKYNIPIKQIINVNNKSYNIDYWQDWYADQNYSFLINSGEFNGMNSSEAIKAVTDKIKSFSLGDEKTIWRLRDWSISRQRYWGTPIPIIHCSVCGEVPVPENNLPVILPENLIPKGTGNPLNDCDEFLHCYCPKCDRVARRETDTMDTFVDSSWYFMRYTSPDCNNAMIDKDKVSYWMPVDHYIGGIEHAILHLLYARFWTKLMRDLNLINFDEPFKNLLCQGMVLNHAYYRKNHNGSIEYFDPKNVENIYDKNGEIISTKLKSDGSDVKYLGITTMSKSKNNGVDPQSIINEWGADTARIFIIFASPPEQTLEWSDQGIEGAHKFLNKLWKFCYNHKSFIDIKNINKKNIFYNLSDELKFLRYEVYKILKQVNYDYERQQYNTVVSSSMKLLKFMENCNSISHDKYSTVITESISILLRILFPIVPHITYQIWHDLHLNTVFGDLLDAPWPHIDEDALLLDQIEMIVQINGKLRHKILVSTNYDSDKIKNIIINDKNVLKFLNGKDIKKIILIPNKLINIVI